MKRLTNRLRDGTAYVCSETGSEGVGHFTAQRRLPELISRLAAYEDTGLSPETVKDLLERFCAFYNTVDGLDLVDLVHFGAFLDRVLRWCQAEKDGRLVVLDKGERHEQRS